MPQAEALLPSKRQITNSQAGFILTKHKGKKIMVTNIMLAMIAMITATGAYIDNSFRK